MATAEFHQPDTRLFPASEPGLLDLQRFIFRSSHDAADFTHFFDSDSGNPIATMRERPAWPSIQNIAWLSALQPQVFEVREHEDQSLVFTLLRSLFWWRARFHIRDADDASVGFVRLRRAGTNDQGTIHTYPGSTLARIHGAITEGAISIVSPEGISLAAITRWRSDGAAEFRIAMADHLKDEPIAKMLLLGSAVALLITSTAKESKG